ncbi:sigma-70 family RNA polymerase sigma factor [Solibacillus sp. FSL H8-0538]|uniref:sigma-70 family RNA polymerase sigma factor n=1 Tax=Solibacillus sp. FSL H8-0538 TaxID=2921400 RepID=UPI0030F80403
MVELDLAKRAIQGNEEALLALLAFYEDAYYRTAFAYMKNEHDAIEAIQEMTYRCLKKIHTVKEPAFIQTWLMRVLLNVCHNMRKKQVNIELKESVEIECTTIPQLEIADIIAELPRAQQELIYLKFFKDLKNSEIAQIQQIPEGTVKSRLHTTLRKLRGLMGERGGM